MAQSDSKNKVLMAVAVVGFLVAGYFVVRHFMPAPEATPPPPAEKGATRGGPTIEK